MRSSASCACVAAACITAFGLTVETARDNAAHRVSAEIMGWQSYCAVSGAGQPQGPIAKPSISRLVVDEVHSHSMFAFESADGPVIMDLNSGKQWTLDGDDRLNAASPVECPEFFAAGFEFLRQGDKVSACSEDVCRSISIQPGTWVYAYAATPDAAVAVTNFGDALIFRDGEWCRMEKTDETYRCVHEAKMPTKPRGFQFYSSIRYKGVTLMGEWPSGRLYLFDGKEIRLWRNQPPHVGPDPIGYEAQSMAEYCGDLYVGYWPTGSIWRLHSGEWSEIKLFPDAEEFIPLSARQPDDLDISFFGRRVTALLPWRGDLYATTSNLRGWEYGQETSAVSPDIADLYGAVWRISRCGD